MQYHRRSIFVNGTAYMDFKRATDRLFDKVDHEDLAQELGVSVAIKAKRAKEMRGRARSAPEWRTAVKALAERRLSHYAALLEDLSAEDRSQKAAAVSALRSASGASMTGSASVCQFGFAGTVRAARTPNGGAGKESVVSLVERSGRVRSFHVADVNSRTQLLI